MARTRGRGSLARRWYPLAATLGFSAVLLACLWAILRLDADGIQGVTLRGDAGEVPPGAGARPIEIIEEGDGFRIVRHAAGTTRVPAAPQRICALAYADDVLAIGVRPVAHALHEGKFPDYLAPLLHDVPRMPSVYAGNMPNMERIVEVRPDLIITRSPIRQTYEQLSLIAPVVVLLDHHAHYRQRLLDIGTIIGRRPDAERRLAWYEAKVAAARAVLGERLGERTLAIMKVRPKLYRLYGNERGGNGHVQPVLSRDLSVRSPKLVTDRTWSTTTSPEDLLHLDADYLILSCDRRPGSKRTMLDLLGHAVWQRVPAIRHDRVLVITEYWHWIHAGILGRARGIDDVLRAVAPDALAAVDAQADAVLRAAP